MAMMMWTKINIIGHDLQERGVLTIFDREFSTQRATSIRSCHDTNTISTRLLAEKCFHFMYKAAWEHRARVVGDKFTTLFVTLGNVKVSRRAFHWIYWENFKSSNCWEYAWYSSRYRREGNAVLSPLDNFFSEFRDKFREKWWKKSKHGIYRKSEAWWAKPGHPYGQYPYGDLQSHHVFTFSPWISSEASLLWETIASSTQSNRHRLCARLYHFAVHPKPIRNQIRRKFEKLGQIWNSRQPVILSVRHSPKQNGWYSNKYEYWIKLAH